MKFSIIFIKKGWLLWSCLFYFFSASVISAQVLVKDKAKIRRIGVVKGRVLAYSSGGDFVFLKKTGDTLVVPASEVLDTKIINSLMVPEKGTFWHSAEMGLNWGRDNAASPVVPYLSLESNHAYVVNKYIQPGIGAGFQAHSDLHIMPLFASLTGEFLSRKTTPFYFANLGYGFAWERAFGDDDFGRYNDVKGGMLWNIGAGLKIAGRRHSTYLKAGYKIQKVLLDEFAWWSWEGGHEITQRTIRKVYTGVSWAF